MARCHELLERNHVSCKTNGAQLEQSTQQHGVLVVYKVMCLVALLCHCQLIWLVVLHVLHAHSPFSV
jgi:hypothetical protein